LDTSLAIVGVSSKESSKGYSSKGVCFLPKREMKIKMPADNEGFGVRRGVVSCDTSQDFGS